MHRRTTGSMFDLCTQHSSSALLQGMHIARPTLLTLSISGRNAMQRAKRHRLCIAIIIICREKLLVHRKLSRHPQCGSLVRDILPSCDQMQIHHSHDIVLPVKRIRIWLRHMLLLIRHLTTSLTCAKCFQDKIPDS